MSALPLSDDFPQRDLIDRIANALPADVRADYYRELMHCRALPENDEMLHILRIMQILALLIQDVPDRIVTEREKFGELLAPAIEILEKAIRSSQEYQAQLDQRLAQLPEEITKRIEPQAIAGSINESLRQQFIQSTIPETARMLGIIAKENKRVSAEFASAASKLGDSCNGSTTNAERAIANIDRAATRLSREYRWAVLSLCGLTSAVSIALGMLLQWWVFTAPQQVEHIATPQVQSAPATANPADRPKNRR